MTKRTVQKTRRIACPELLTLQGELLTRQVIELSNGQVVRHYPLKEEQAFTEWTINRLDLREDEQGRLTLWNDKERII